MLTLDIKNIGSREKKTSSQLAQTHQSQENAAKLENSLSEQNKQIQHEAQMHNLKLKHLEQRTIPISEKVEQTVMETKNQLADSVEKVEGALKQYTGVVAGKVQEVSEKVHEAAGKVKDVAKIEVVKEKVHEASEKVIK
jgi:uncharacterized protein YjbJ (UPF0337 family)